jgi:hypothetical protein
MRVLLASFIAVFLVGCGSSGEFPVAPVKGVVTCEGKPVPYAMIFFEPIRTGDSALVGKQGFATADEKGQFVVTTYRDNDGAVLGNHNVHVMPPHAEDHPGLKRCPCEFDSKKEPIQVAITEGSKNEFTFALPVKKNTSLTLDEQEALQEAKANAGSK